MKIFIFRDIVIILFFTFSLKAFSQISIHQQQLNYYKSTGLSAEDYQKYNSTHKANIQHTQKSNCSLTKVVYDTVKSKKCVSIYDRITPLDYWVCVLAFIFDLNYKETYMIVKEKDYINILIDKFKYNDLKTKEQMEEVRNILNSFINEKIIQSSGNSNKL